MSWLMEESESTHAAHQGAIKREVLLRYLATAEVDVIQSVQHPDGVRQSAAPDLALTRRIGHVYWATR